MPHIVVDNETKEKINLIIGKLILNNSKKRETDGSVVKLAVNLLFNKLGGIDGTTKK